MLNHPCCGAGTATKRPEPDSVTLDSPTRQAQCLEPPAACGRKRASAHQQPDPADGARPVRGCAAAAPLCDGARTAQGITGIELPRRSIEHVAPTDGTCRDLPAPTERTDDSGAADRECLFVRLKSGRVANDPDARSGQMRSLLDLCDPIFFVRPTARLTCGAARPLRPCRNCTPTCRPEGERTW